MTKKHSTKKALLVSVLSLLLCVSMLIGTTFAWFTDNVTSGRNTIQSGNLDVVLEYWDGDSYEEVTSTTKLFNDAALWEPGYTEVAYLKVSNAGSLALKYQLAATVYNETLGKTKTGADIKLSDYLVFKAVESDTDLADTYTRETAMVAAGTEMGLNTYNSEVKALEKKGDTDYVALIIYMPTTVGNEANHDGVNVPSIEMGVNLFATQYTYEEDSFDNQYDKNAIIVTNAAEAQAALDNAEAGATIKLAPGNYGTLVFGRNASNKVVDISDIGGDGTGNERYSRYENITILGAAGATVDQITFDNGREDANTIWNYIDVKNLTIKNVTFSGASTAVMIPDGFAIAIDGLSLVNCKMTDTEGDDRFVYQPHSGYKDMNDKTTGEYVMTSGVKNLTITGCEITGAHQVIEARQMENLTITNNTFNGIKSRDIMLSASPNGITYTGTITITGNTSNGSTERFVRGAGIGDANVVIKDNTILNYMGKDADYIKVTDSNGTPVIENNTLVSIGVKDAAAAQAALDNAVAGTTIQLQPGVNYGALVFGRNASSRVVDISDIGGDGTDNERYSRYENITILGAAGATVDQITFDNGREDVDTIWNYIDVKNLTIKNVTFSGASTAVMIPDGFAIAIDGLSLVDCKMTDTEGDDRFVYQPHSGYKDMNDKTTGEYVMTRGVKNLTITGCEITGAHQVIEARPMDGITITNNVFKNSALQDILLAGSGYDYTGITITGNTSDGAGDRFVRATSIGNGTITITGNTVTNNAKSDPIKVDGVTDGNTNVTVQTTW